MKTGIEISTLQSIYKKNAGMSSTWTNPFLWWKKNTSSVLADCVDSCCPSCPVSLLSPCELCLKRQRAAWGWSDYVRSCHMAPFISPCCHNGRAGGEGHHSGKACWDTWTVSHSPASGGLTVLVARVRWQLLQRCVVTDLWGISSGQTPVGCYSAPAF